MASNSGCTEVLVDGAITPNFLRKPSESVMGGSLPQVAYGRQWRGLRLSLRTRRSGEHPPYRGRAAARTRPEREPLPATVRHARILTLDQERAMLRTGKEHLESLRDGRVVYIGCERVEDVTRHPAFRNAAATVAALYDIKADPANRESLTYEEDGGRHSIYFLRPRTREDLQRRMLGHRRIADATFGMFGRSPITSPPSSPAWRSSPTRCRRPARTPTISSAITATSGTTTSMSSMPCCRRRRRAIR